MMHIRPIPMMIIIIIVIIIIRETKLYELAQTIVNAEFSLHIIIIFPQNSFIRPSVTYLNNKLEIW